MLGKIEGRRRRGDQWMTWPDDNGIINAMEMNLGKLKENVRDREGECYSPWGRKALATTWATEQQQENRS